MTQTKFYKYLGRNGNILTSIVLEDINPIPMIKLIADDGKILTNDQETAKVKLLFLDEVDNWYEIEDPLAKKD